MTKRFLDLGLKNNNKNSFFGKGKSRKFDNIVDEIEGFNSWDSVVIFGSEPTARNDFFKIISKLKIKGINKISLITNARAFNYSSFVERLRGIKELKVFVELMAPTFEMHDKITGTPGSFTQTIKGIEKLIEKEFDLSLIFPVVKDNSDLISGMGELSSVYDIKNIVVFNPPEKLLNRLIDAGKRHPLLFSVVGLKPELVRSPLDFCLDLTDLEELDLENEPFLRVLRALERFHNNSLIYVSPDEVYYMFHKFSKGYEFLDFAHDFGFPVPVLMHLFRELEKERIVTIDGKRIKLEIEPLVIENSKSFREQRLEEIPSICQLRVDEVALLKRADFVTERSLGSSRIAILGDDDFFSLILASKKVFQEIFVFELDERICEKIKSIAEKENYNIRVVKQDLRKEFSPELIGKFDVFYTDCPYSVNGFTLFFSRGLQLLKKERKKRGFMSFSPNLPIESVEMGVQKVINDSGVFIEKKHLGAINEMPDYIRQKYDDFSALKKNLDDYESIPLDDSWFLSSLGREEQLFSFLTTSMTRPLIRGKFDGEIYYGENPLAYYTDKESIKKSKSENDMFKY
ncbi:MAG: bis-aminopropyl spermidine synthase family protein [Nanobdellota archaeon]